MINCEDHADTIGRWSDFILSCDNNKACMIALPGINNKHAVPTPINPEQRPIINVSAVNTCDTLRLLAPIARSIPISFVLSRTEIYVIIPIIIEETTNETTFSKLFS